MFMADRCSASLPRGLQCPCRSPARLLAVLKCRTEFPCPLHSLPLHSPSPSLLCLSLPAPWPSGQDAAAADVSLPLLLPPAAATISASSPLPHGRSAVSQGCRCSRQHCHQQGRRGRRWRTWPDSHGQPQAGPRPPVGACRLPGTPPPFFVATGRPQAVPCSVP